MKLLNSKQKQKTCVKLLFGKFVKVVFFDGFEPGFLVSDRKTASGDHVELDFGACHGRGRSYGGQIWSSARVIDRRDVESVVVFKNHF